MNIIEAIKSDKDFKRKQGYLWHTNQSHFWHTDGKNTVYEFAIEDILADDWEIQEESITITESEFDLAWRRVWDRINKEHAPTNYVFEIFKEVLGFGKKE